MFCDWGSCTVLDLTMDAIDLLLTSTVYSHIRLLRRVGAVYINLGESPLTPGHTLILQQLLGIYVA